MLRILALLINRRSCIAVTSSQAFGFTLIELMLVIFIVGMMATGITMVSTQDRLPKQIRQETQELQASIRRLQSFAMIHQKMFGLSFNDSGWRLYSVVIEEDYMQWGVPQSKAVFDEQPVSRFAGINDDSEGLNQDQVSWLLISKKKNQHFLSKQLELQLFLGEQEAEILDVEENVPQIMFSAQGDVTPFYLLLRGVNSDVETMLEVTHVGDVILIDDDYEASL